MILVFAGAGASKAVDPQNYPTTQEFFQRLPKIIVEDPLFRGLVRFVQGRHEAATIDIEQWLWAASEARQTFASLANPSHAAGWLFADNRVNAMVGASVDVRSATAVGNMTIQRLEQLEETINRLVYDLYRKRPSHDALQRTWVPILKLLADHDRHLEIFATNYDVVLEEALKVAELPIDTGRRADVYSEVDEGAWLESDAAPDSRRGLLTKLHGSVDWSRIGEQIYFGTPKYQGEHRDQVIIYPGFKGVPTQRPFTVFHEHFSRSAERATAAVFIGFAFRDDYINQVLRDRLDPTAPIIVVNPAESIPSLPFPRDRITHIREGLAGKIVGQLSTALLRQAAA